MRLKAIINPVSGSNAMRSVVSDTVDLLKDKHYLADCDIFYTTKDAKQAESSFFDDCDVIMVAGGDGTLHNAINNMKQSNIEKPIAYLPTGTMNDFGSCLNLPRTPENFCKMIESMETKQIDLGLVGDEYFHYVVAGGSISPVSYTTNQDMKNIFGKTAYYFSLIPYLPKLFKGTHIDINCAEVHEEQDSLLYFVTNSSVIGGVKGLVPDAKMDDGQLHVLVIQKGSMVDIVKILAAIGSGKHIQNPKVKYFKTQKLSITQSGEDADRIGIDGELRDNKSKQISVVPRALTLVVPTAC